MPFSMCVCGGGGARGLRRLVPSSHERSEKPILWDKVICRNSVFPFQTLIFPGFTQ